MHIIAIGASAGGLQAIKELFQHRPVSQGEAYVVIIHAPRDYKSQLVNILSRITQIKAVLIKDNMRIQKDTIHISPSSHTIDLEQGIFRLAPRAEEQIVNHTIDHFFNSIAKSEGPNVIGIIMSGTGTDGTDGSHAIENNGGLVIVQDPETALFDGMPLTSIRYDHPDYILPPKEMPALIETIIEGNENKNLRKQRSTHETKK